MSRPRSRRLTKALALFGTAVVVAASANALTSGTSSAAGTAAKPTREKVAQALLDHRGEFGTAALHKAWTLAAGKGLSNSPLVHEEGRPAASARQAPSASDPAARAGLPNVRVNNPATDVAPLDQTTPSETSVAVSRRNVAVGYNDSHLAQPSFTSALNLTGYSYSTDAGRTFTDGGALPRLQGYLNLGDPWLASGREGNMYFANLAIDGPSGNLEVGVARSTNGGRTWTAPVIASPNDPSLFYSGDKEAITTGPAPGDPGSETVYAAWDDFSLDLATGTAFGGLPVARSTDGGQTWALSYADKITQDPNSCSFAQYLGAQPFVDDSDGRLYVFAEKIVVDDPDCTGGAVSISQVEFVSTDGGTTFGPAVKIADVGPSLALDLAHGQIMRTAEFPTVAKRGNSLLVAWNDGTSGKNHVRLARSTDRGATWTTSDITSGSGDEVQPALSADRGGLHLAYYQRNADNTLDVTLADSFDAVRWTPRTVTTRSFPGVDTAPPFDPIIAPGYMGDYIANVSAEGHQYLAWGDNRDRVTNVLWPDGRQDPNVYFARR